MPFPLISIIVITYNSSEFILEMLESAKNQTYNNKELIISDDFSSDDTLSICAQWIKENKHNFVNVELVKTDKNSGIAPNLNRGLLLAKGEWIKLIAGDDLMLNSCLTDNYNIINDNKLIKVLFTNSILFKQINGKKIYDHKIPNNSQKKLYNTDSTNQFFNLINSNLYCPAPSSFIHRKTLMDIGAFDEEFPFYEDYPLWLRCVKNNIILYYSDVDTVLYRQSHSISRGTNRWSHKLYYYSKKNHFNLKVAPHLQDNNKMLILSKLHFIKYDILIKIFRNKKNFLSKSFNYIFDFIFFNEKILNKKL